MSLERDIHRIILANPGTSRMSLRHRFDLSDYRLNRVFRHIQRRLTDSVLLSDATNGVWIVAVDPSRCSGMDWVGVARGGYRQCGSPPKFSDGRCYEHSECENPEMVAFLRMVAYVAGPAEPTAYGLCPLGQVRVEELLERLYRIIPMTRKDMLQKVRLLKIIRAALATLRWRELRRRRADRENWIPPEFWERHRRSSVNPFEFSLKKHFQVLDVPVDAEREEVLKAWKSLCRRYHPDVAGGDEERMKQINLAKERIFRIRRWN